MQEINPSDKFKMLVLCADDTQSAFLLNDTPKTASNSWNLWPFCPLAVLSNTCLDTKKATGLEIDARISEFSDNFASSRVPGEKLVVGLPELCGDFCVRPVSLAAVTAIWNAWAPFRVGNDLFFPQLNAPAFITGKCGNAEIPPAQLRELSCNVFYLSVMTVTVAPHFSRWELSNPVWFSLR